MAGLSQQAKEVAVELNLDDNESVLRSAAGAGGTPEQIESLRKSAKRLTPRQHAPEQFEARKKEKKDLFGNLRDHTTDAAERLYEYLGPNRSLEILEIINKAGMSGVLESYVFDKLRVLAKKGSAEGGSRPRLVH